MLLRSLTAAVLSATFLIAVPAPQAQAGNAGKILGGLAAGAAAGIIAHKVYKHQKRKKRARRYYSKRRYYNKRRSYTKKRRYTNRGTSSSRVRSAFNQNTFNTQTWLNQLGYNAGSADGISGRRTRTAIRQFQIANGMPATGALSPQQTATLSQQAAVAVAGVAPGTQVAAAPQAVAPAVVAPAVIAPATGIAAYQALQPQQPALQPVQPALQPVQPQVVQPALQPVQPQVIQPVQPQVVQPVQPQIIQPAQPQAVQPAPLLEVSTPVTTSPAASGAPYSTMADRPAVLGVTVGGSFVNVPATLQGQGFVNCESFANAIFCEKSTGYGSDKIAVAANGGKIHTITRKLSFNQPTTPANVFAPMPASYKPLIDAANHKVASSPACGALVSAQAGTFDAMVKQSMVGNNYDASTTGFSHACNYYFAINLPEGPTVKEVELTFFDSSAIVASLGSTATQAGAQGGELKF
ncbi:MAG: peptidoglycan-binding domain-containing protein [Hyphomicrobiales bacterium]